MGISLNRAGPSAPAYSHARRNDPDLIERALAGAVGIPFWLDSDQRPIPEPPLSGELSVDLLVVGGGYTGLWTALMAKERDPGRSVALIEAAEIAWAASGRNGGFCESSLTHGEENGRRHFAADLPTLARMAAENLAELEATLDRYGIDADFEKSGILVVATDPHQVEALSEDGDVIDADTLAGYVKSPLFRAGVLDRDGCALVNPAKLAWGLKRACLDLGVKVFEETPALQLKRSGSRVRVRTTRGFVDAGQVALGTNGFPGLLRRVRLRTVPIYDYVLVTEPLSASQLDRIGWTERFGIADSGRQFHYYRRTSDDRILFGGFDATYHRGGQIKEAYDQRPETFEMLADHFFSTFPPLKGIRFSHKWGGMIDMSTRLVAFQGLALGGSVAYSAGYTGLGVGATRFGANVMLDLLGGQRTERTELKMVRTKPLPVPPEPLAYPLIQAMRRAVIASDENGGVDGPLLRLAARFGVHFDS
jgi:glycine/D-amino acid oxidase-like deaminating enzyme